MALPVGAVIGALGGLATTAVETEGRRRAVERIRQQELAAEMIRRAQTQALFDQFRAAAAERRGVNSAALLRGAQEQAVRGSSQIAANTAAAGAQEQSRRNEILLNQGNRETDFLRGAVGGALDAVGTAAAQDSVSGQQQAQAAAPPAGQAFTAPQEQFTSDKRLKSRIKEATGMEEDEFLNALDTRRFLMFGQPRTGVMAQDLQQTEIGREMVNQQADGTLQVDGQRALEATMGAAGRLNERLQRVERLMQRGNALEALRDAPNLTDAQRTAIQRALPPRERTPLERQQLNLDAARGLRSPEGQAALRAAPREAAPASPRSRTANPPQFGPGKPADNPLQEAGQAARRGAERRATEAERAADRVRIGLARIERPTAPDGALGMADPRAMNSPGGVGPDDAGIRFNEGQFAAAQERARQALIMREQRERLEQLLMERRLREGDIPGGRVF